MELFLGLVFVVLVLLIFTAGLGTVATFIGESMDKLGKRLNERPANQP